MAIPSPFKARLLVGDFALHAYTRSVDTPFTQDMLDTSVISDQPHSYIPGQLTTTLSVDGLYDTAASSDLAAWASGSSAPVTFAPAGLALGTQVVMHDGIVTAYTPSTGASEVAAFALAVQGTGQVDNGGVSLHDLTAVTSDESGTGHDGGAASSNGAIAHLHVTAFSGFSATDVIVEDSANNSDWATIGTFTTVAGVTAQRLAIAGTVRRYTRYSADVTGTGSVTFAVALARQ